MLKIFRRYSAKSSLLDDFGFYENREKTLNAKKNYKSAAIRQKEDDLAVSSLSFSHTHTLAHTMRTPCFGVFSTPEADILANAINLWKEFVQIAGTQT